MPILHGLPPVIGRENRLLGIYHQGLREHWGWADRKLGNCFALAGLGSRWTATEQRLLSPEIRASGLSMAARRGVHRLLNPLGHPRSRNLLRNKALFARHVVEHRLPAPASFDSDEQALDEWLSSRSAIIAKPGFSSKGRGIAAFRRDGDHWHGAGREYDAADLARHLQPCLDRHGVIQELLSTHEQLRALSPGALPTLRIVTCRNEMGEPESCATILRLGSGGACPVDNFNAGGIAVRLDASGRCTAAFRAAGTAAETIATHPASGVRLVGRMVPDLEEAIALGEQAHRTLPGYTVVGWDVGLSDQGPTLVEGNWNPGTDIIQLVDGAGIDRTRLGELYRYHLERLPDELWRASRPVEW